MSLVKSMRKYSNKIMVFLLIFIMVGFVLGASLPAIIRQFTNWFSSGHSVAVYGDVKVDRLALDAAQNELKILSELMADRFLMAPVQNNNPNMKNLLLAQVLFPDPRMAALVSSEIKRSAARLQEGALQATAEEIDSFFLQINGRSDVNWLLLKAEAKNAGIVVPDTGTKNLLKEMIPAFTGNTRDAAMVVNSISERYMIPQGDVIRIFSDLLGVMTYASNVLKNEDITIGQIKSLIGLAGEKINAETVRFEVSSTDKKLQEPGDSEIAAQLEKYKDSVAGVYSNENPYGFGYKQPATVVLEYMIINLEDVEKTIKAPMPQEMEDFYQDNLQRFTMDKPVDPNKPDGEKVSITQDYSDVASNIRNILVRERTASQADLIMINAVDMVDEDLMDIDMQDAKSDPYKEHAGDYVAVGKAIGDKYKIEVYTLKTGRLSSSDLLADRNLGSLTVQSTRGIVGVGLDKLVFAIDELGETILGKFDPTKPAMWQNIGPMKSSYGAVVAIVRVVEAKKSYSPENVELVYDTKGTVLDSSIVLSENMYNLKGMIIEDLKKVAAVKVAKEQAEEFVRLLKDKSWDDAITEFNKGLKDKEISVSPVSLSNQREKTRSSLLNKKSMDIRSAAMNSSMAQYMNVIAATDELLQEKLYNLIPENETEAKDIRAIVESAPEGACLVVKDVSRSQVTIDDYEKTKLVAAYSLDMRRSDSLALIHFSPDNIVERMGFEWTVSNNKDEEAGDDTDEDSDNDGEV